MSTLLGLVQGFLLLLARLDEARLHLGRNSLDFFELAVESGDLGLRGGKYGLLVYRDLVRGISLLPEAPLALLGLTDVSKNSVEDAAAFLAALLKSRQRRRNQPGRNVRKSGESGISNT